MARKCSPPKTTSVKSHWRAAPRKKRRSGPRPDETYYVAENEKGHTCGHHHRTRTAAMSCAQRENRRATRKHGRKAATYLSEPKRG